MKTLSTIIVLLVCGHSFGQDERIWFRNDVQVNVGSTLYDGFTKSTSSQRGLNRVAGLISYDGFLTENLSIGVFGGILSSALKDDSTYLSSPWWGGVPGYYKVVNRTRRLTLGIKVSTYFVNTGDIQVFGGAGLGIARRRHFRKSISDLYDYDIRSLTFLWDIHLGANYYFHQNIGVTASLGYPLTSFKLGLTYRY